MGTDEPYNSPGPQNTGEPSNSPGPQNTDEPSNLPGPQNTDEPFNSPGPQNVTNKSSEGDQQIKLESVLGKVEMPESQTSKVSEEVIDFKESNIKLLGQLENHESQTTEKIDENNSGVQKVETDNNKSPHETQIMSEQEDLNDEILIRTSQHKLGHKNEDERCCQVPSSEGVSTEIGDESRSSILENRILQFVIVIVAVLLFYLTFFDSHEEVSNVPKVQTQPRLVRGAPSDVLQGLVELSHLSEVTMRK